MFFVFIAFLFLVLYLLVSVCSSLSTLVHRVCNSPLDTHLFAMRPFPTRRRLRKVSEEVWQIRGSSRCSTEDTPPESKHRLDRPSDGAFQAVTRTVTPPSLHVPHPLQLELSVLKSAAVTHATNPPSPPPHKRESEHTNKREDSSVSIERVKNFPVDFLSCRGFRSLLCSFKGR